MARIFLSYAREDAASAKAVAQSLESAGHDVWWDEHIRAGAHFAAEIDRELKAADLVIVLWSAAAVASPWVLDEAAEGRDSGRLLPLALDGCRPPLGFRQFQTVHVPASVGSAPAASYAPVLDAIEGRSGHGRVAAPSPAPVQQHEAAGIVICVLPFANLASDPEQEYFSDGITEDVITDLSKISRLDVVARNSAFAYKGQRVDAKQLAAEFGATHVVAGSVRKSGPQVRITAQLIEAATSRELWAERFDRDLTDIFAIQDEISHAIVDALQLKLLPTEKKAIGARSTSNAAAYDIHLKARQLWIEGNLGDVRRSEEVVRLCLEATAIDPDYADAWALMALAQAELRFSHGRDEAALTAAERAIALDPDIAEPYCVKARYFEESGDYASARKQIETALRLKPDSWEANREAARLIWREGKVGEAIPLFEKAVAAMKTDHHSASMLISCYNASGNLDGVRRAAEMAVARAERIVAVDPANGAAYASGAGGLAALGHSERAKKWVRKALNVDPGNLTMRYNLACTLASVLHDTEAAIEVLEPFAEGATNQPQVRLLELDPDWASVRDLPRFQRLLEHARKRVGSIRRPTRAK